MIYGYARVSTTKQDTTIQRNQLIEQGCEKIFQEKVTGRTSDRPQLKKMLEIVQKGDVVIVTKIDRIARNMKDGLEIIESIRQKGAAIRVLNMGMIDDTPVGELILNVLLSVAQFEVDISRERQLEGIKRAKELGKYKGRPKKYTKHNPKMNHAIELYRTGSWKVKDICNITGVSSSALYRRLQELDAENMVNT
ncbi:recombinase family protein [Lysinibacillus fusiformis]|uniref:recombinase family protein n=1 Tax=Lysinibacillus fusiformis TaxID=28031 RepID=UPI003D06C304